MSANTFWVVGADMVRTEGPSSLWHGLNASLMREFIYSGLRLGTYEYFKDRCVSFLFTSERILKSKFRVHGATGLTQDGLGLKAVAATIAATFGSYVLEHCS